MPHAEVSNSPAAPYFEDAPFQRAHWKLAIGATTGYLCDGYTLGVVGIALAAAQTQLSLTPLWLGALGGASLAGLFAGALASGALADRFGRRPIFAYNMVLFAVLSLAQLFVDSAAPLLMLRFCLGVVLGSDYVVCKALLIEFMPRTHRGRALSLMGVAWACGYALAYVAGFLLKDIDPDAWRWILASSAVPALLAIPLRMTAPESPPWLMLKGRCLEAQTAVDRAVGAGYRLVGHELAEVAGWRQVLSPEHRGATCVASVIFVCLVVPYFAVSTFIPQVMSALHVEGNEVAGLVYILCLLVGAIGGCIVVDWFPRRVFVVGSFSVTALALFVSASFTNLPAVLIVASFALFACVLSAAQTQVYAYLPELFSTAVRASGLGVAVALSRVGAAAATFLLPWCVARFGIHPALYVCVAILALGGIACYRWAPETRQVRLS